MNHLLDNDLIDLLFSDAPAKEFPDLVQHLKDCLKCRQKLRDLKTTLSMSATQGEEENLAPISDDDLRFVRERVAASFRENDSATTLSRFSIRWLKPLIGLTIAAGILFFLLSTQGFLPNKKDAKPTGWNQISFKDVIVHSRQQLGESQPEEPLSVTSGTISPIGPFDVVLPRNLAGIAIAIVPEGSSAKVLPENGDGMDLTSVRQSDDGRKILGPFEVPRETGEFFIIVTEKSCSKMVKSYVENANSRNEKIPIDRLIDHLSANGFKNGFFLSLTIDASNSNEGQGQTEVRNKPIFADLDEEEQARNYDSLRIDAEKKGDFEKAISHAEAEQVHLANLLSQTHWQVIELRHEIERLKLFEKNPDFKRRLDELKNEWDAESANTNHTLRERIAIRKSIRERLQQIVPEGSKDMIDISCSLAQDYGANGDRDEAESLMTAIDACSERYGAESPTRVKAFESRMKMYMGLNDHDSSLQAARKAYETAKLLVAQKEVLFADQRSKTSVILYLKMAVNYGERLINLDWETSTAEAMIMQVMRYCESKEHGPEIGELYEASLHNLGTLMFDRGRSEEGAKLLEKAAELTGKRLGTHSLEYAQTLAALGSTRVTLGMHDLAEKNLAEAQRIIATYPTESSRYFGIASERLRNCKVGGPKLVDQIVNETLSTQANSELKKEKSKGYAYFIHACGIFSTDDQKASEFLESAGQMLKELVGANHSAYIKNRCSLAIRRQDGSDKQLLQKYFGLLRDHLDASSSTDNENEQISRTKEYWPVISRVIAGNKKLLTDDELYSLVLTWKGTVFLKGRSRTSMDENVENLRSSLINVDHRISTIISTDLPNEPDDALEVLLRKKDELVANLNTNSLGLAALWQTQRTTLTELKSSLDDDDAIVDYFAYEKSPFFNSSGKSNVHLVAFVIRPKRSVERVELGPIDIVQDTVKSWLVALSNVRSINDPSLIESTKKVDRLVWEKIATKLSDVAHVYFAPDGVVNYIPFALLSSPKKKEQLLIETHTLSVLSVPQFLALQKVRKNPVVNRKDQFLVIGDIDFDYGMQKETSAPQSASTLGQRNKFGKIEGGQNYFSQVLKPIIQSNSSNLAAKYLSEATIAKIQIEGEKSRFVHMETHGWFDENSQTTLGLALTGANTGTKGTTLTPLLVSQIDFSNCEVITIAACESRMGPNAAGEGLLGMQRAFEVAGANSTVASLWTVDKQVTRSIMARFYEGLLREGHKPALALRTAQLAALKNDLGEFGSTSAPKYWAAWVVSGTNVK